MEIRRAGPGDLQGILKLCREHAAHEGAAYPERERHRALAAALFGAVPVLYGWVAGEGGGLAGYMTATLDFSTWDARHFVHMDCLYLRPEHRRAGLGWHFLSELRRFAAARGCRQIQWQTPPDNDGAIAFYTRLGAAVRPKRRFYLELPV